MSLLHRTFRPAGEQGTAGEAGLSGVITSLGSLTNGISHIHDMKTVPYITAEGKNDPSLHD